MAEGRFLSRNIAFSEQLGAVSMEADYLFMRMLPHLDSDGRLAGSAKSIRARVCPLRTEMSDEQVLASLAELDQSRLINWYEVDGMQCVEYPNFERYQIGLRKDRESPSKIPASAALGSVKLRAHLQITDMVADKLRSQSGVSPEDSREVAASMRESSGHSKGSKGKLREGKLREDPASDDAAPSNWVADLAELWTEAQGGVLKLPKLGASLKELVRAHPYPEIRSRWRAFAESPQAKYGAVYFAEHFGDFASRQGEIVGADGDEFGALQAIGVRL